jgi:hypothetical protein
LHEQIAAAFDPSEICPYRDGLPEDCPPEALGAYRFFSGRFRYDEVRRIPGAKYVFTVLRDPRERVRSLFRFLPPRRARALAAPCRAALDNDMARRLAGRIGVTADGIYLLEESGAPMPIGGADIVRLAWSNLGRLDFHGFTDRLDMAYARVAHDFGLPQAAGTLPRRNGRTAAEPGGFESFEQQLTASLGAELGRLVEFDSMIYELARRSDPACPEDVGRLTRPSGLDVRIYA